MNTNTATATNTFDRMTQDERWLGFGYLGGRQNALDSTDPEAPAQVDAVAEADAYLLSLGLTYEELFTWANSKDGRWFADAVFGGSGIQTAIRWGVAPRKAVSRQTPPRSIRVPDDLWEAAKAKSEQRGETVTDAVIRALKRYVRG